MHEDRFKQRRLELQGWLREFAAQYDAIKLTLSDETDLEAQNKANGIDIYRANIHKTINDWILDIRDTFSCTRSAERPIFQGLLSWVHTAKRLMLKRPQFFFAGEKLGCTTS